MRYNFCTYLDKHYLPKGLALYRSLARHCRSFHLWVLCLDRDSAGVLRRLRLPNVSVVNLADVEEMEPVLRDVRMNRTALEYCYTCTPFLPLYVLRNWSQVDLITYLDADLFFFADPEPVFRELGSRSIGIIEHRFPDYLQDMLLCGKFNVGWISFRRDDDGIACLEWWGDRCLEWCHDRIEPGRYGDQKYLDDWPARFGNVAVLAHKGCNVAPWNVMNHAICRKNGRLWVDDMHLVFYHFHGVNQVRRGLYEANLSRYGAIAKPVIREWIYGRYINVLGQEGKRIAKYLAPANWRTSLRTQKQADGIGDMLRKMLWGLQNSLGCTQRWHRQDYYLALRELIQITM